MITIKEVLQAMKDGHIVSDHFMFNPKPYRFYKRLKNDPKNTRVAIKNDQLRIDDIIELSKTHDIYINAHGYVTSDNSNFNYHFANDAIKDIQVSAINYMRYSLYSWMNKNPNELPCFLYFDIGNSEPFSIKGFDTDVSTFRFTRKERRFQVIYVTRPCTNELNNYVNYLKLKGIDNIFCVAHYLQNSNIDKFMLYLETICSILGPNFSNEPF